MFFLHISAPWKSYKSFQSSAHHACSPTPTKISIDILLPGGGCILSISPFWPLNTIHTHLAYNVISAYLIVLVTVALRLFYVMQLKSVFPESIFQIEHQILMDEINVKSLIPRVLHA